MKWICGTKHLSLLFVILALSSQPEVEAKPDNTAPASMPANEQKIIEHLKREGRIHAGMSRQQIDAILKEYLRAGQQDRKPIKPPVPPKGVGCEDAVKPSTPQTRDTSPIK